MFTSLFLIIIVSLEGVDSFDGNNCSKLRAAFSFNGTDYFIHGENQLAGLNVIGQLYFKGDVGRTVGFDKPVTAAAGFPGNMMLFMESGKDEQTFNSFHVPVDYHPLARSHADHLFHLLNPNYHGIDAAVRRGVYELVYFSACLYIVVDLRTSPYVVTQGRVESLGLPCGIDAAIVSRQEHYSFVIKGNKLWPWAMFTPRSQQEISLYEVFPSLRQLNLCE